VSIPKDQYFCCDFAEISKTLTRYRSKNIIILDQKVIMWGIKHDNNAAQNFEILATCSNVHYNYLDSLELV